MKFAMFGAGGTGGVLGGYLALAGHDVTLIARGRHLEALRKDGLTIESAHLRVIFGFRPDQAQRLEAKAKALEKLLQDADIRGHYSLDIRRDALTKFGFVSPMGAAGLYHDATSEAFQKEGAVRDTYLGLIREVEALGKAMGIVFEKDLVATGIAFIDAFEPGLKTSMQRDVEKGGLSEFDGLVNRIVALGERYHVPVPLYKKISDWGKSKGIK